MTEDPVMAAALARQDRERRIREAPGGEAFLARVARLARGEADAPHAPDDPGAPPPSDLAVVARILRAMLDLGEPAPASRLAEAAGLPAGISGSQTVVRALRRFDPELAELVTASDGRSPRYALTDEGVARAEGLAA